MGLCLQIWPEPGMSTMISIGKIAIFMSTKRPSLKIIQRLVRWIIRPNVKRVWC